MTSVSAPKARPGNPLAALGDLVIHLAEVVLVLAGALLRQPLITGPLAVCAGAGFGLYHLFGLAGPIVVAVCLLTAPILWRLARPVSFERLMGRHLRNARVRLVRYERRWRQACRGAGLDKRQESSFSDKTHVMVPKVLRVHAYLPVDRVLVRMLDGQVFDDLAAACPALQESFDVLWVRARRDRHTRGRKRGEVRGGRVWLEFQHFDPLRKPIAALPIPAAGDVDLEAVPVGLLESGEPWCIRLLSSHILLIGATRAGKSSWLWSLIRGLAPLIKEGSVRVWASDPKGGMELGLGEELCERFVANDPRGLLAFLRELVKVMDERAARQRRAKVRCHTPTVAEPLIVLILDELLASMIQSERGLAKALESELRKLMVEGAACGITIIGAAQNPEKELIKNRDEFTIRIGFRMNSSRHPDMTFFDGARAAGATCDLIDPNMKGEAIFLEDGSNEFGRGRVAYVSDADVLEMAAQYGPGATPTGRLKARLEGRDTAHVPMSAEQRAEVEAIMLSFAKGDEAKVRRDDWTIPDAEVEGQPRPRSAA